MFRSLALVFLLASASASSASDCYYQAAGGQDDVTAWEAGNGYDVAYGVNGDTSGAADDHCALATKGGSIVAKCDSGWKGPVIYAGASLNDVVKGGIMVLAGTVFFHVCR